MAYPEIVHEITTDKGVVVNVTKRVLAARGDLPEKTTFSVTLGRKRTQGDGSIPLFLMRGENADNLVMGLERAVSEALVEAERLFKEALPPRPVDKRPRTSHKPRKEAYDRVGTHGKIKTTHKEGD